MPKEKITIDDLSFLVSRLITALSEFNEQIKEVDLSDPSPIVKKETAEDLKIRERYIRLANMNIGKSLSQEERDKYTNPTPSEFLELKREYRKWTKEYNRREADKIASELSSLKQISIEPPITINPFNEDDIIGGRIIVTGAYKDYGGAIGLISKVDPDNKFPLEVFVCKQDFTPGKRKYEINTRELVSAIIEPKNIGNITTTYLIRLAVKHSIYFNGLIYLKNHKRNF